MARLIFLDTGTLGIAARRPGDDEGDRCRFWITARATNGDRVIIPELADYEVRRGLLKAGATAGIHRLDDLKSSYLMTYLPIRMDAMLLAAELWTDVRRKGQPTASDDTLDGDAVLVGQAVTYSGHGDEVIIATGNRKHLTRFAGVHHADEWEKIGPRP